MWQIHRTYPKQAACKALTAITIKLHNMGFDCDDLAIRFELCEKTQDYTNDKMYYYTGAKVKLTKPVEVSISRSDGSSQKITYCRKTSVEKMDINDYMKENAKMCKKLNYESGNA